jgi:putative oxygen-independent coproporphyrinogen III oxidase
VRGKPPGLYVHVPFCRRKCGYCDFVSVTDLTRIDRYVAAVVAEASRFRGFARPADSLYLGGGTPSLLTPRQLEQIITALAGHMVPADAAEITLEVNPGTVNAGHLAAFRRCGVNRVNIGVQSFDDAHLAFLGRIHSGDAARRSLDQARRAGYERVGLDLIYGLPGQTPAQWRRDLATALELAPGHLSCYLLSIEPGTPLHRRWQQGGVQPLDDAAAAELFLLTHELLESAGCPPYEISNFARTPADRSRHNLKYWNGAAYRGFGPAAHSFDGSRRWWNHKRLGRYLDAAAAGRSAEAGGERLTRRQQMIEAVYLGLRQTDGIDVAAFERRFQVDFGAHLKPVLTPMISAGHLTLASGRCRLTPRGRVLLDALAGRLAAAI